MSHLPSCSTAYTWTRTTSRASSNLEPGTWNLEQLRIVIRSPLLFILPILLIFGCDGTEVSDKPPVEMELDVPVGFDPVPVPEFNRVTLEKVELGERLFFDTILSQDRSISCARCHEPEFAFADPRELSLGVENRVGIRNSPTLVNVAYQDLLFWDGGSLSLESQALAPLEDQKEMAADLGEILERLNDDDSYAAQFAEVFADSATVKTLTQALASYQRTIRSGPSRYDRFENGQDDALSDREKRGLELFSGKADCTSCHDGFLLTSMEFENNGLPFITADSGRARITLDPNDFGKFKVPSLRNVGLTAPYMHDGRFRSLEEVVAHYNAGGSRSRGQSPNVKPLGLSPDEVSDLITFLRVLTDDYIMAGSTRIEQ